MTVLAGGHFSTRSHRLWLLPSFFSAQSFKGGEEKKKRPQCFERTKTSGCTLANHVISWRIYPKKAWSHAHPAAAFHCFLHHPPPASPYNNTRRLFSDFPDSLAGMQHLVVNGNSSPRSPPSLVEILPAQINTASLVSCSSD